MLVGSSIKSLFLSSVLSTMTAADPSDKFNSLQVTSLRCRVKVILSILPHIALCLCCVQNCTQEKAGLYGVGNYMLIPAHKPHTFLLISFTPKTHMDFSACPRGILCNLHLKVQKKGKPTFHYPETAAPNVTTTQVRLELQRLITGK